jgi:hypothetical protein|tara:strand:+ start:116 stop:1378 length:1263 start_codon:yes stop_codon:yes gene_type:complete
MLQKEVLLSNKDKILFPLFLLSIILIAVLMGNIFSTILLILITILIIAFIYSTIKIKSFNQNLIVKIKETSYVLSFSIFTTMIFSTILPYLLFHNSFINIFVIQYIYVLPILLIFFASLYVFNYLIKKEEIQYKHLIKSSVIISIILSVVISIMLISFSNYLYNERTEIYNDGYDKEISEFNEKTQDLYSKNLPIFNEIKTYQDDFLADANQEKSAFQTFDKKLCLTNDCAKNVVDKAYHLITIVVNSMIIQSNLEKANEELVLINEEKFKPDFNTLDDYSKILKEKVESSEFTIQKLSTEDKETLSLVESDFNYNDLNKIVEKTDMESVGGWADVFVIESNSIFYDSISYTFKHSAPYKELVKLVTKVMIFTGQQGKSDDIFVKIYNNKDVDEPLKSKIIRNKLILTKIEPLFVEESLP